jgi:hypothetical protein
VVLSLRDGRITDAREHFFDLNAWDEFWSLDSPASDDTFGLDGLCRSVPLFLRSVEELLVLGR